MEELEERQKPKKSQKRRSGTWNRRRVVLVLLLALLVVLTIAAIANRDRLTMGHFSRAIQYRDLGSPGHAAEFRFANLGSNTFASLGDGIAVASVGGLRLYDRSGSLAYTKAFEMTNPVIQTAGNYVLAYDLGGFSLQTGNRREALVHIPEWDDRIIHASINANGWIALSAEQIGTRGHVAVIDSQGNLRWHVQIGADSGHVIGAVLANNNRTVAVLTMTDTGSRILWYSTDIAGRGDVANYDYLREGEIFFDIWTTSSSGGVGVISKDMVLYLTPDGAVESSYHFRDRHLRAYDIADGRVVLYLSTGQLDPGGELVVLDPDGSEQRIEISGNLVDLSLKGRYLAALFADELLIFRNTSRYTRFQETEGMSQVLMREDGTVFRLSQHRARLLVP